MKNVLLRFSHIQMKWDEIKALSLTGGERMKRKPLIQLTLLHLTLSVAAVTDLGLGREL